MYDENGIIHTNNTSQGTSIADTNSACHASSSVIATQASDSNSPTASGASDCCSLDSLSGDRLNQQLLLYQSLAASNPLLPLLNQARRGPSSLAIGVSPTALLAQRAKPDPNMALINTSMMNVKDSRWLQVEVCREFQRGQCSRNEQECKFAHPPPHVDVQNGRVTACYDHLKGRCTRDNPKCKFLHAPQHLKDQLLLNGRNNLALKNYMTQLSAQASSLLPPTAVATAAAVAASNQFTNYNPLAGAVPGTGAALVPGAIGTYSPYAYAFNPAAMYPGLVGASQDALGTYGGILPTGAATSPVSMAAAVQQAQKAAIVRVDRVEVCREFSRGACQRGENECKYAHPKSDVERANDGTVVVCIDFVRKGGGEGACTHKPCRYYHPPPHLLPLIAARLAQQPGSNSQSQTSQLHNRATPTGINGSGVNGNEPDQSSNSAATAALLMAYQQQLQQQILALQPSALVGNAMQMPAHAHASAAATSSAALPASSATMQAAAAAQAYAASQLAAVAQHQVSTNAKKRPLEADTVISAHSAATDPLLLAAAALQSTPVNKRAALEKGGVPVFQPVTPVNAATMNALQYPQFAAAFPGIQTSYVPVTFAGHPPGLPRL